MPWHQKTKMTWSGAEQVQEQFLKRGAGKARSWLRAREMWAEGACEMRLREQGARPSPREQAGAQGGPPMLTLGGCGVQAGRCLGSPVQPTWPLGAARPGSVQPAASRAWSPQRGAGLAPGGFWPQDQPLSLPQQPPHKKVVHGLVIPSHPYFFTICRRGRKSLVPGPICGGQGWEQEARGIGLPAHLPSACCSPRRSRRGQGGCAWGWPDPGDPAGSRTCHWACCFFPALITLVWRSSLRPGHARAGPTVSPRHPGSPPRGPT